MGFSEHLQGAEKGRGNPEPLQHPPPHLYLDKHDNILINEEKRKQRRPVALV